MSKNARANIPAPKITPPVTATPDMPLYPACSACAPHRARCNHVPGVDPPMLAVVPPPARVASVQLLEDRIVLLNATIDLTENMWLKHVTPHVQTKRLLPERAEIIHGVLVIDEYGVTLPLGPHMVIRTKEVK